MAGYRLQVITNGYPGAPGYNNFYMVGGPGEVVAWAAEVGALWNSLKTCLANGTTYAFDGVVEEFDLTTGQTTAIAAAATFSGNGTWGTAKAPGGTALVLQWRSGIYVNGREIRGRSFISGIGDIGDSNGVPNSTQLGQAQGAASAYSDSDYAAVYSPTNADIVTIQTGGCWNKFGLIRSRRD